MDGFLRCTAADPQGLVEYLSVGLVGPHCIRADDPRCIQPIAPQGLLHVGTPVVCDDIDGDRALLKKDMGIWEYRGVDPMAADQAAHPNSCPPHSGGGCPE